MTNELTTNYVFLHKNKIMVENDLINEEHLSVIIDDDDFDGMIEISWNNQHVKLKDSVAALIQNLCFEAAGELHDGKNVVIHYYNHYGALYLNLEDDSVLISGDDISTTRVPKKELLISLFTCGKKFISFLEKAYDFLENSDKKSERDEVEDLIVLFKGHYEKAQSIFDGPQYKI